MPAPLVLGSGAFGPLASLLQAAIKLPTNKPAPTASARGAPVPAIIWVPPKSKAVKGKSHDSPMRKTITEMTRREAGSFVSRGASPQRLGRIDAEHLAGVENAKRIPKFLGAVVHLQRRFVELVAQEFRFG